MPDAIQGVIDGIPVNVYLTGGGGSGGTSEVDEAPFIPGTSLGTPIMGVVNPSDTPADGDLAIAALDSARRVQVAGSLTITPIASDHVTAPVQTPVGTGAVVLLAANPLRERFTVQNSGTSRIKLAFGAVPTQTAYHVALPAGGSNDDGSSTRYVDDMWKGEVQGISSVGGGTCVVAEFTA